MMVVFYFLALMASAQQWNALGPGVINAVCAGVSDILIDGYDLYAIGSFVNAGGLEHADFIAKWDGQQWYSLGESLNGGIQTAVLYGGQIYITGDFTDAGGDTDADFFAKWDGQSWLSTGVTVDESSSIEAMVIDGADIYIGGAFTDFGGNPSADYLARWDGDSWQAVGGGVNYRVTSLYMHNGNLYAGGFFENAGGNPDADFFARWDGQNWHGYPGFPEGFNRWVQDFIVSDSQDIYTTGSHLLNHWDGNAWYNYDPGIWGSGQCVEAGQGEIYVGTNEAILRWDLGSQSWDTFPPLHGSCRDIEVTASDLYAVGHFYDASDNPLADHIARWGKPSNSLILSGVPNLVCKDDPPFLLPVVQSGIAGSWSGHGISNDTFYPALADTFAVITFTPDSGQVFTEPVSMDVSVFYLDALRFESYPDVMCPSDPPFYVFTYTCAPSITGLWSGPGINPASPWSFDPVGLNGLMNLTFTPDFSLTSWDSPYQPLITGQCIVPPTHMIDVVDLNAVSITVNCADNGTPTKGEDDFLVLEITPLGQHADTTYSISVTASDIFPQEGSYNTTTVFQMEPGSAGGGDFALILTDPRVPNCTFQVVVQDPGPCVMVGLNESEVQRLKNIVVYPNPTDLTVYITGPADSLKHCGAVVMDSNGEILYAYPAIPEEISMMEWPAGVYYVKLQCDQDEIVRKIVRL